MLLFGAAPDLRVVRAWSLAWAMGLAVLAAGCSGNTGSAEGPPRADDALPVPSETSQLALPLEFDSAILARAVEEEVPRELWSIDRYFKRCIPRKKVHVLGKRMNVVPKVRCRIVGTVTRGEIRMRGEGQDIVFDMPIRARLTARDVGGVLTEETATGDALVQARIRLELAPDWSVRGKVRLRYDWTTPPGVEIFGERVTFADEADKKLEPIMRRLEASLPRRLARLGLRERVEKLWNSGFTSVELNSADPQVWLRVTPERPYFDGYALAGDRLRLRLGLDAGMESFVGPRPADPAPAPLPPPGKSGGEGGLHFFIPVVADYGEVEPMIAKALDKRSQRPFEIPRLGEVEARFADVAAYGTSGGRLAIGFDVTATPLSASLGDVGGRIWLEAKPVNDAGSAEVTFERLVVTGDIEGAGGDMLLRLANSPAVTHAIAEALGQNFTAERDRLVGRIGEALSEIRGGDFVIKANISDIETGRLEAHGKGLYLPVKASGDAVVSYHPQP